MLSFVLTHDFMLFPALVLSNSQSPRKVFRGFNCDMDHKTNSRLIIRCTALASAKAQTTASSDSQGNRLIRMNGRHAKSLNTETNSQVHTDGVGILVPKSAGVE